MTHPTSLSGGAVSRAGSHKYTSRDSAVQTWCVCLQRGSSAASSCTPLVARSCRFRASCGQAWGCGAATRSLARPVRRTPAGAAAAPGAVRCVSSEGSLSSSAPFAGGARGSCGDAARRETRVSPAGTTVAVPAAGAPAAAGPSHSSSMRWLSHSSSCKTATGAGAALCVPGPCNTGEWLPGAAWPCTTGAVLLPALSMSWLGRCPASRRLPKNSFGTKVTCGPGRSLPGGAACSGSPGNVEGPGAAPSSAAAAAALLASRPCSS